MIPPIDPYELPTPNEVPPARVSWTVDPSRCALLIHDVQNYFIDAFRTDLEPAATMLANIVALREACHAADVPVVYTAQPGDQHPSRRGILADFWGSGLRNGRDTLVVDALTPGPTDIQVTKWRYSAFQRTDLRELLGFHGRDQLIVTGVYAHMGVMLSAAEAFMSDVRPFVVRDATADFTREEHVGALEYVAKRCGMVVDTAPLTDLLVAHSRVQSVPAGAEARSIG